MLCDRPPASPHRGTAPLLSFSLENQLRTDCPTCLKSPALASSPPVASLRSLIAHLQSRCPRPPLVYLFRFLRTHVQISRGSTGRCAVLRAPKHRISPPVGDWLEPPASVPGPQRIPSESI